MGDGNELLGAGGAGTAHEQGDVPASGPLGGRPGGGDQELRGRLARRAGEHRQAVLAGDGGGELGGVIADHQGVEPQPDKDLGEFLGGEAGVEGDGGGVGGDGGADDGRIQAVGHEDPDARRGVHAGVAQAPADVGHARRKLAKGNGPAAGGDDRTTVRRLSRISRDHLTQGRRRSRPRTHRILNLHQCSGLESPEARGPQTCFR